MLYYHQKLFLPIAHQASLAKGLGGGYAFGNDFYPLWLTARDALRGRDPYSPEMTREIQGGLFGRTLDRPGDPKDLRTFAHPAFTLLVIWPAAQMPFEVARIVLGILLLIMTVASVLLWFDVLSWNLRLPWIWAAVLLTLCSYPALEGLYAEQLGLAVAFLLVAGIVALQRGRLLLAGLLIALAWMKPQITMLVTCYLLAWSFFQLKPRGRFLIGFFATLGLLLAAALLVWPRWIQEWVRVLLHYHAYSEPSLLGGVLTSLLGSRAAGPSTALLTVVAIIACMTLAWTNRSVAADTPAFILTLSVLLAATTIAILPGQAIYDHVILLPGILLVIRRWPELRSAGRPVTILLMIGAVLLFWPFAAAIALVLANAVGSSMASPQVLALPLRTSASLPFALLALLGYALKSESAFPPKP